MNRVLEAIDLTKRYGDVGIAETVLRGVSFSLGAGEACVLLGPSGSGKTTLLAILGCLLKPSEGNLLISGERVNFGDSAGIIEQRRRLLGFVFQHSQLLPFLTVAENLTLFARNAGLSRPTAQQRAMELLESLDLRGTGDKRPGQLSGGQRQRVAVARALVHRPQIILADEPTAALDWQHGSEVADRIVAQTREEGTALLIVTHDTRLIPRFDRVFSLVSGKIYENRKSISDQYK